MMRKTVAVLAVSTLLGLAGTAMLLGCGQAKADPLEVTYYYLPG